MIVWVLVVGGIFAYLWQKGYLLRLSGYIAETQEELKKCTWPTKNELIGSTVVVFVSIAILGTFTLGIDFVISLLVRLIT